ncbi:hypothetical protein O0L34_g5771 [Tuta absoluta]|nr:hypothetical protein O0L34_g5771 [Tuta absoluta]
MDVEFLAHQFEDGYDGVVVKTKFSLGVRHLQVAYMFVCAASLGVLRASTGVAVLAMNDVSRRNDTYIQIYEWDGKIQGAILSSFLFGYALMLVPAEVLTRKAKTCGKHVLTVVLLSSGALAVAMPTIVKKGGWIALCNAQLWMGATQACLSPANQSLLAQFLLPNEKGIFSTIVNSGTIVGILIGLPISAMISEHRLGWELIFYSQAMLTLSVGVMWVLLTASTPDQHEAMGDTEKEFIKETLSNLKKRSLQVPWINILQSRQFWATTCAHAASNALFVFFLYCVPVFLVTCGITLRESSWVSILPFIALILRVMTSPTIDWFCRTMRLSFQVNLSYIRKLINAVGACAVVAGLFSLPNLSPTWYRLSVVVLVGILGMLGFQFSGFLESYKDLSENYHGSLFILSRAFASLCAALVPVIVGVVLGDDFSNKNRWHVIFLVLASGYAICNIVYTVFGSSNRQFWDGGNVLKDKFGYHNNMLDTQMELEELSQTKLTSENEFDNSAI